MLFWPVSLWSCDDGFEGEKEKRDQAVQEISFLYAEMDVGFLAMVTVKALGSFDSEGSTHSTQSSPSQLAAINNSLTHSTTVSLRNHTNKLGQLLLVLWSLFLINLPSDLLAETNDRG